MVFFIEQNSKILLNVKFFTVQFVFLESDLWGLSAL